MLFFSVLCALHRTGVRQLVWEWGAIFFKFLSGGKTHLFRTIFGGMSVNFAFLLYSDFPHPLCAILIIF